MPQKLYAAVISNYECGSNPVRVRNFGDARHSMWLWVKNMRELLAHTGGTGIFMGLKHCLVRLLINTIAPGRNVVSYWKKNHDHCDTSSYVSHGYTLDTCDHRSIQPVTSTRMICLDLFPHVLFVKRVAYFLSLQVLSTRLVLRAGVAVEVWHPETVEFLVYADLLEQPRSWATSPEESSATRQHR